MCERERVREVDLDEAEGVGDARDLVAQRAQAGQVRWEHRCVVQDSRQGIQ